MAGPSLSRLREFLRSCIPVPCAPSSLNGGAIMSPYPNAPIFSCQDREGWRLFATQVLTLVCCVVAVLVLAVIGVLFLWLDVNDFKIG